MIDIKPCTCAWSDNMDQDDEDWEEEEDHCCYCCYCCCVCCRQELGRAGWACLLGCFLATVLLAVGFSTNHWINVTVTAVNVVDNSTNLPLVLSQSHSGLWRECDVTLVEKTCEMIRVMDMDAWYQGVVGVSIVALLSALLSLLTHCLHRPPITAIFITITGLVTVAEVGLFGIKMRHLEEDQMELMKQHTTKLNLMISTHLDWSFFLTLGAAGVYLLVGIAAGILALREAVDNNKDKDVEEDSHCDHDMDCLVPPASWVPPRDFDAGFI